MFAITFFPFCFICSLPSTLKIHSPEGDRVRGYIFSYLMGCRVLPETGTSAVGGLPVHPGDQRGRKACLSIFPPH